MYLLLLLMLIMLISILYICFRLDKDIDSYIFKHRDRDRPTYGGRQLYDNFDIEFLRRKVNSRRSKF